jgi:FKBP-type peptidyl-prolyl cis-trans isomerase FkpA
MRVNPIKNYLFCCTQLIVSMNKIYALIILSLTAFQNISIAQTKPQKVVKPTVTNVGYKTIPTAYTKINNSIAYKIFSKGKLPLLIEKDIVEMHSVQSCGDSILNSTYRDNAGKPVLDMVMQRKGNLDFSEAFFKMGIGDSLVVRFTADSVLTQGKPPYYKDGDELLLSLKVVRILNQTEKDSLKAEGEKEKEKAAIEQQKLNEIHQEDLKKMGVQEEKEIVTYLEKNKLKYKKTDEGLYYVITKQGTGPFPKQGSKPVLNYEGYFFLDNKKFDSNTDSTFGHTNPFEFTLGTGMVINGWEQGVPFLNAGSKAIFIIPSRIAYGERGFGELVKPNTVLRYEVELISFK